MQKLIKVSNFFPLSPTFRCVTRLMNLREEILEPHTEVEKGDTFRNYIQFQGFCACWIRGWKKIQIYRTECVIISYFTRLVVHLRVFALIFWGGRGLNLFCPLWVLSWRKSRWGGIWKKILQKVISSWKVVKIYSKMYYNCQKNFRDNVGWEGWGKRLWSENGDECRIVDIDQVFTNWGNPRYHVTSMLRARCILIFIFSSDKHVTCARTFYLEFWWN